MTPEEFVKGFYIERKDIVETYFDPTVETDVSQLIKSMKLDAEQTQKMKQILLATLRDGFYTVLLGIDGEANIGGNQMMYNLSDEDGNVLTGGEIEAYAWDYFHNNKFESE